MNMKRMVLVCAVLAFSLGGCYKATVETGLAASGKTTVIWAHSWIHGLVPPDVVKATSECSEGVAVVETQHTFVSQLVRVLTFGIYTPMQISVTCAQSSALDDAKDETIVELAETLDYEATMAAFAEASDVAVTTDRPAYVVW